MRVAISVIASLSLFACASSGSSEPRQGAAPETIDAVLEQAVALAYELDTVLVPSLDDCDRSAAALEAFRVKNIERMRKLKPKMDAIDMGTKMRFIEDQGAPMIEAQERVLRLHSRCTGNTRFDAAFTALDDSNIE